MITNRDFPKELHEFNNVFLKASHKWNYDDVFRDFIDYSVACFLENGDREVADRLKLKYEADYKYFNEMFVCWIHAQNKMICNKDDWYDGLGTFYEVITSSHKSSILGQFFTPPTIVNLMSMITMGSCRIGAGERINDPASGSGRMLISAHAKCPGNYCYGADLDSICAKMTALNMCIHGCIGEAVCMDSLAGKFYFGYEINTYFKYMKTAVPHLIKIDESGSFQMNKFNDVASRNIKTVVPKLLISELKTAIIPKNGQLSFW